MDYDLHLVTGGTGFIGSALVLELLQRTQARVVALVRPGEIGAQRRLHETLCEVARLYGHGDNLDEAIATRSEGIAADLLEPGCGVAPKDEWAGAQLWHCAASLQFQDRHAEQIFATNVDGTKRVVALAESAGIHTLNMISTAYVAGTRSGVILEEPVDNEDELDAETNNHYERSKILAENAVLEAQVPRVRIMRPSIVIGHSRLRTALNFNGLYGFVRNTYKFRRLIERTQRQLASELELRVVADPDATVNMIPVDIVAADAVALALADASGGVYHLSSPSPPPTRRTLEIVFETVGLRPPTFVSDRGDFSALDRKFNSRVDFYTAYLTGAKHFDRAQTDRYVEDSRASSFALDEDELRRFCGWYVDKLEAHRPRSVAR